MSYGIAQQPTADPQLADYLFTVLVEIITQRANTTQARNDYATELSQSNFNNPSMNDLHAHALKIIDLETHPNMNDHQFTQLINAAADSSIKQHIATYILLDRAYMNAVCPDQNALYMVQADANKWHQVEKDWANGGRQVPATNSFQQRQQQYTAGRQGNGGNFGRVVAGNPLLASLGYATAGKPVSTPLAAGGGLYQDSAASNRNTPKVDLGGIAAARTATPQKEVAKTLTEQVVASGVEGPDFSKDRPYDDFVQDGERWQLAHRAKLKWQWSPKQQFRRAYNPAEEVAFLVLGKDNVVQERFIPMNDQLSFVEQEIREAAHPHRVVKETQVEDIVMLGEDLDVETETETTALDRSMIIRRKRKISYKEVMTDSVSLSKGVAMFSDRQEANLSTRAELLQSESDVAVRQVMLSEAIITDGSGLDLIGPVFEATNLKILHGKLSGLSGIVDQTLINSIDAYWTVQVNNQVRNGYGFPATMSSFVTDFDELLTYMLAKRGQGYVDQFLQRTASMCHSLTVVDIDDESAALYLQGILPLAMTEDDRTIDGADTVQGLDVTDKDLFLDDLLVLQKVNTVVATRATAESIGVMAIGKTVTYTKETPEGDFIIWLYGLARAEIGYGAVLASFSDGILCELTPCNGARDIISVTRL